MADQATGIETVDSQWRWLRISGGAAALMGGILLLMGLISLIFSVLQPGITNGWFLLFQDNWLVKIFMLHAEVSSFQADLHGLNYLDIVILLLVSVVCLSLSTVFRNNGKVWSLIAVALSLIAIILFVATQITGRSTVMLAVLINSLVMLRDKTFSQIAIYLGIFASIFLFVGDLTVGVNSPIITTLFSIGYVLLIAWFFLIAQSLFRLTPLR